MQQRHRQATDAEQEEAQEEIPIEFPHGGLDIGFNVGYLLDALAAVDGNEVEIRCY